MPIVSVNNQILIQKVFSRTGQHTSGVDRHRSSTHGLSSTAHQAVIPHFLGTQVASCLVSPRVETPYEPL
jgi:hypothetical protein